MSANQTDFTNPGGAGVVGTPVDPAGPGGILVDLEGSEVTGRLQDANQQIEVLDLINTGLISGGEISINGGDSTKFDVAAGEGVIVDHSDPTAPVVTRVSFGPFTAVSPAGLGSTSFTSISINSAGSMVQSTTGFTQLENRLTIELGSAVHQGAAIDATTASPRVAFGQVNDIYDFVEAIGALNVDGNVYSAAASDLTIAKSTGQTYDIGTNYGSDKRIPSITSDPALSPATLQYTYQDGVGGFTVVTPGTSIDPEMYDDGSGTLASVPAGEWTVQRIWYFAQIGLTAIHYGQSTFATESAAQSAIRNSIVTNPLLVSAVFRGWLVVKQGATDLSNAAFAKFTPAGKFGLSDVLSGAGGGEANTASNIGSGGIGLFKQKNGVTLELRNINVASSKLTVALDAGNNEVDLDAADASESQAGVAELATQAEASAGTDDTRIVTALKMQVARASSEIKASSLLTTTSLTDVVITGLTTTPASGTYLVFSGLDLSNTTNNQAVTASIYVGGVQVINTERERGLFSANQRVDLTVLGRVTVNGSQAIDIRWRTSGGTAEVRTRNLIIMRVAA